MSDAKTKGSLPTWIYQNPDGSPHSGVLETHRRGRPVREFYHYDERAKAFAPGFNTHERILYAAPVVAKAEQVILCDNEAIVAELGRMKLPATCAPYGFTEWSYSLAKQMKGKSVLVLRSQDQAEIETVDTRVIPTLIDHVKSFQLLEIDGPDTIAWLKKANRDKVTKWIANLKQSYDDWLFRLKEKASRTSDSGNARLFAITWGDRVKYVADKRQWVHWVGSHWKPDDSDYVGVLTRTAAERIWEEVKERHSTEDTRELISWAKYSLSSAARNNMLRLAQSEPLMRIHSSQLDTNPSLITVKNGTFDLDSGHSGELRDHREKDYITHALPASCNFNAPCTGWGKFIDQITEGDESKALLLQQAAGYTLSGHTDHQVFFFLHGPGGSGKSTFCEILLHLMGSLGAKVSSDLFMDSGDMSAKPFELAQLIGKRFVLAQEVQQGHLWNEGRLKDVTGQDTIRTALKHRDGFEYKPQFKLWFYANHWPTLRNVDKSIRRRMIIIPLTYQPKRTETGLQAKLLKEIDGILSWCMLGYSHLRRTGWVKCEASARAAERYFEEQDTINLFLSERTTKGDSVKSLSLYEAYRTYCAESGYMPHSQRRLAEIMEQRGYQQHKRNYGKEWVGIRLRLP